MFSIEFWAAILLLVDLLIIVLLLYWWRNINHGLRRAAFRRAVSQVFAEIEPLLKASEKAAKMFEDQLKKKKQMIEILNEKLDNRIISLNLLLNRAENYEAREEPAADGPNHVYDQLAAVAALYEAGSDAESISEQLSMPKGEVELVLDMKRKLLALQ